MFTIGICSSEREKYLTEALESVLAQDFSGPIQVVVSDDNSKTFDVKNTLEGLLDQFREKQISLRLIYSKQETNPESKAGEGAMRNKVVANSSEQFIVWLDDDDKLLPDTLSTYAATIKQNPGVDVFYGDLIRTDENLNPQRLYQYRDIPRNLLPSSMLLGSIIPNGGSCINRAVFEKVGLYDPTFIVATDYQFWARVSLAAIRFKYVNHPVYLYRSHSNNAALDKEDERFFETNSKVCELLLRSCPTPELFPFFEWNFDKSLAECQVTLAILALAKRNRNQILVNNCVSTLLNKDDFKKYLVNSDLSQIFDVLNKELTLTFDKTAEILSQIILATKNLKKANQ